MSYEHYLKLKERGPISAFLLNDQGIKLFPVCINLRKFIHQEKNHFVQLNVSFEILFDIENYFSIGYDFYHYAHHQSNLTEKEQQNCLHIKQEPLYEYGNEEEFLPKVEMISTLHNEQQILDFLKESFLLYEKEQNVSIWSRFILDWDKNKKKSLKNNLKDIDKDSINRVNWFTLFELLNTYETNKLLKGKL
jgi:hypothetical protein